MVYNILKICLLICKKLPPLRNAVSNMGCDSEIIWDMILILYLEAKDGVSLCISHHKANLKSSFRTLHSMEPTRMT